MCQSRRKHCIVAYFRRVLPVFSDFLDRRTRRRPVLELFGIASPIFRVVKVRTGVPLPAQARRSLADFSLVIGQHEFRVVPLLRTTFSGELKKNGKIHLVVVQAQLLLQLAFGRHFDAARRVERRTS
jgi:hypothetical protein